MSIRKGDTVQVVSKSGAPGRKSPGGAYATSKGKKLLRSKGFSFVVADLKKSKDGTVWARTNKGTWYSTKRLGVKSIPTAIYGMRVSTPWRKRPNGWPNHYTYWTTRGYHTGADYAADHGTAERAVTDGTVHHLQDKVLGNVLLLYSDNGSTYWYCHTSARIKDGSRVTCGQTIAKVGMTGTGASMGPHLHLERRAGHTRSWAGADINPLEGW